MTETKVRQSPLHTLSEILSLLGFAVQFLPADTQNKLDQLFIGLDQDAQEGRHSYILQLFFMEDILKAMQPDLEVEEAPRSSLQMVLKLPVAFQSLKENQELEGLRLIILLNKLLPVGNFGLEGENNEVYFRYVLMGDSQNFNGRLIIEVIEQIRFFIQRMAPLFEACVQSEKTALQVLDESELLKQLQEANSILAE